MASSKSRKRRSESSSSSSSSDSDSSASSKDYKKRKHSDAHTSSDSEDERKSKQKKHEKKSDSQHSSSTKHERSDKPKKEYKSDDRIEHKKNESRNSRNDKYRRSNEKEERARYDRVDERRSNYDRGNDRNNSREHNNFRGRDRNRSRSRDHNASRGRDQYDSRGRDRNNSRGGDRNDSRSRDQNDSRGRRSPGRYRGGRNRRSRSKSFDHANAKWGKKDDKNPGDKTTNEKEKVNFGLSGKLTEETNTFKGVVIKYSEPPEARKPKRRWRLYPFKGEKALQTLYIHRESGYLIGRDRKVVDIPVDHPSCSKQHAALQYRLVTFNRDDGSSGKRVRPYLIDLESANGTFLNGKKIEPKKYVELFEKDVIKFGFSSREYVLLHENSKDEAQDDDVKEEEETKVKEEKPKVKEEEKD